MLRFAPHEQRVVEERAARGREHSRLVEFMANNPQWFRLEPAERERMRRQAALMEQLCGVLDERIRAFKPTEEPTTMQIPTIGRRVYFYPDFRNLPRVNTTSYGEGGVGFGSQPAEFRDREQPFDAGVVFVHSPELVNLSVTDHVGTVFAVPHVQFFQEPQPNEARPYACWMPYQRGASHTPPPATDAHVAVGSARFSDGKTQTEQSLAMAVAAEADEAPAKSIHGFPFNAGEQIKESNRAPEGERR